MVKIRIDRSGRLWLKRGNKLRMQICPNLESEFPCGDWCPLFDEPIKASDVTLRICQGKELYCKVEEFVDERI